ncbi:MAG: DUF542 domain-containing protein [Terriglobia bacterium]
MKVGDVARIWPRTMRVFARHNLDLCCGGKRPLHGGRPETQSGSRSVSERAERSG